MTFRTYTPGFPLSELVDSFWAFTSAGVPSSRRRICPKGAMEFVINLAHRDASFFDEEVRQSVRVPLLAGPYSKSFLIDPAEHTSVLGVRFKPGRARVFFPIPADKLHNTDVSLYDLLPREAERLYDDLLSATGVCERFEVLERYLRAKLSNGVSIHPAVTYAVDRLILHPGARSISAIRADVGLSHTRFIQLFRESVGLTPNVFSRIQRFQTVLRRIETGQPVRWAELASDCGYFDQAHLIRDFRAFSGTTPGSYIAS